MNWFDVALYALQVALSVYGATVLALQISGYIKVSKRN